MTKGKRKQHGRQVHQNKYASQSKAEEWLKRKLAEPQKQVPVSQSFEQGKNYRKKDSSYDLIPKANSDLSSRSKLDKGLEDGVSDEVPQVEKFGFWWSYKEFKFMSSDFRFDKGFSKDEVPDLYRQLVEIRIPWGSSKDVFVRSKGQEFYVYLNGSYQVVVSYTITRDEKGEEHYSYRRTSNPEEVVSLRGRTR